MEVLKEAAKALSVVKTVKVLKTVKRYLLMFIALMMVNDLIQIALAYRENKKRLNKLAFKRLARMKKKANERAKS
ncbi:MAG: hypothetical protein K6G34_03650 [Lachnospiraceae bacterium]|nr:hypothetical protein [Lachnospiraceae bacterium]